ncbi:tetratricopeptide repeat protein [Sphingomonas sp. AOB5]|uniref:tetratricopeptide repeat protein n=1 Tax=Sphingomonas sp. AOB5 TaxID=3034017 RepID=UPI0023F6343B|nr:tetratricopeptide repeat protein [Sphingomonas sp. AOB5]MDF7774621.1 tetratricopeptide repeat protein [Sphingomonas sp. AOB5]
MALPPNDSTNDAFVREVDEEYRREQLLSLWRKWGRSGLIVLGVALAALAAYLYFNSRTDQQAGKQGEQFSALLEEVKTGQAAKAGPELRKLATDGRPGYRVMALFTEADLLLAKGDLKGAASRYASVANDSSVAQPFRDLALIQQTRAEFDSINPQVVMDRLKGLATPDSPWLGTAGETIAAAYIKQGKRAEAGKMFATIAQSKGYVPDNMRQRALEMAGAYGVDASGAAEEKKAQ